METGRGDAAAATWIFRGYESRRRDVDIPRVRVAATPRPLRGNSVETAARLRYQANNFVGAAEALYALGAPRNNVAVRVFMHFGLAAAILLTLFFGDTDRVSAALGVVSVGMVAVFAAAVAELGVDAEKLFLGLLPTPPPSGSAVVAVSLVATTAVPFNAFLASCSAKPPAGPGAAAARRAVSSMRRGVTLSTWIAAVLSVLIVATGAGVDHDGTSDGDYGVPTLVSGLRKAEGSFAVFCFGLGLYLRRADIPLMNRGAAAAATWIFRGNTSRRLRRGFSARTRLAGWRRG